jgi:photosystem II stability/assembly factor-like uncharacterized protein
MVAWDTSAPNLGPVSERVFMQLIPSPRTAVLTLVVSAGALGWAIAGAPLAPAAAPRAPKTVKASRITRPAHTLAPGSAVAANRIFGNRVFADAKHGFALVDKGQAQYPAATTDGGKTWKTDGPALHLNAAQAPLSVTNIGAASRRTIFAWGSGQVIDVTSNGGKQWYRALFQGLPVAVVKNPQGHLVAFVDGSGSGSSGVTSQYVSKDGGKSWHLDNRIGGS